MSLFGGEDSKEKKAIGKLLKAHEKTKKVAAKGETTKALEEYQLILEQLKSPELRAIVRIDGDHPIQSLVEQATQVEQGRWPAPVSLRYVKSDVAKPGHGQSTSDYPVTAVQGIG